MHEGRIATAQFLGGAKPQLAWTDRRLLEAFDRLCRQWGDTIRISGAFRALADHVHTGQSLHYAGLALDIGSGLPAAEREALRRQCVQSGDWDYVDPAHIAPTWIHVQMQLEPPAQPYFGYPKLQMEAQSVYVCVLQELLRLNGSYRGMPDGVFGPMTLNAFKDFQIKSGLAPQEFVNATLWRALFRAHNEARKQAGE
ncbi:MAG: peptidoglycan-binding protein [Bacillota bacterium]